MKWMGQLTERCTCQVRVQSGDAKEMVATAIEEVLRKTERYAGQCAESETSWVRTL